MTQTCELQTSFTNEVIRTELSPRWVRATFGGETIADSKRVVTLLERGRTPAYYFPEEDVRMDLMTPTDHSTHCGRKGDASYYTIALGDKVAENAAWYYPEPHASDPGLDTSPDLRGYVALYWDMLDGWFEEEEEVFVHARDPYKRLDAIQSSRHVKVVVDGVTVADSHKPVLFFETGMPTRYYLPKMDVRLDLLQGSERTTRCPYKGEAHYYSVGVGEEAAKDIAWYYRYPTPEASKVANHIAFYNERVDATYVDGEEVPKPERRR